MILSAQFETIDFSPGNEYLAIGDRGDGFESGIGGYFRVKFPDDWPDKDKYDLNDFSSAMLEPSADPFQAIDYNHIEP